MSTDLRPTAKIYQFPRRPQAKAGVMAREALFASDRWPRAFPAVECGSGWYHEAAIQAERVVKS
jgi:uncharacterized protein DUF2735